MEIDIIGKDPFGKGLRKKDDVRYAVDLVRGFTFSTVEVKFEATTSADIENTIKFLNELKWCMIPIEEKKEDDGEARQEKNN